MLTHLPNLKTHSPNFTLSLCGKNPVKTMSHHEIKRGKITCPECLTLYTEPTNRKETNTTLLEQAKHHVAKTEVTRLTRKTDFLFQAEYNAIIAGMDKSAAFFAGKRSNR